MKRLRPVVWMKGTFLSPQYLQAQDRFLESSLQFHLDALSFRPYGFLRLAIDQEALATGFVSISSAAGIFPDGLLFDVPESDPPPARRPVAEYFQPDTDTLDVYLALPQYRDAGLNVALSAKQADSRYLSETALMRDENTGLAEKPVQLARKNLRLLFGTEAREGFTSMPVARIQRTSAEMYRLDQTFVPPLLDYSASDSLTAIARRLLEILSTRSSQLAGTRRQRNLTLADFGVADIANFWLLYAINSHMPLFQHLFESRKGHPETLFSAMASLAGALTTFSTKIHPRDLPRYDHDHLSACFTDMDQKIRLLLDTVVPSNCISLPLKLVQPSIYATSLAEDRFLVNTRMYLAVGAEMNEADLLGKAPQLIKVCSANHIEHLVRQALPGLTLAHVPKPPSAIPVKLNCQYFSLSQSGPAWSAVTRARNLAAYVPADFPNPQLELLILLPEAV